MTPQTVLNYAAPRILFDRPYRHRSWHAATGAGVLLVMAGVCAFMGEGASRAGAPFVVKVIANTAAIVCIAGFAYVVNNCVRNHSDPARITEDGIEVGRRHYAWDGLAVVYGNRMPGGIVVQFELRNTPERKRTMAGGFTVQKSLPTTPLLTLAEFETLIDDLGREIVPSHPHVKLDRTPRRDD